jgi:predicted aspartyl protease
MDRPSETEERSWSARVPARRGVMAVLLAVVLAFGLAGCIEIEAALAPVETPTPTNEVANDTGGELRVPLQVVEGQGGSVLAFVPITIDGQGPYRFALDTGASRSLVDQNIAEQLDLPVVARNQPVTGVGGAAQADVVEIEDWRLGDVQLPQTRAATLPLPGPGGEAAFGGLLGSDILSQYGAITVDYDEGVLILRSR